MHGRRLTWLVGGIGLIACGVAGVIRGSVLGAPATGAVLTLIADVLWAGAILLLAFGVNREGSVVARKPLGVVASAVVALWPATHTLVNLLAGPYDLQQADDWQLWGYVSMVLPLVVGLIAAMSIARTGVVPAPWNWAPLGVLGIQSVTWLVPQLIGAASPGTLLEMPGLVTGLGSIGFLASTLGLGIPAVVLANRSRARTVPVFPSSTSD